MAFELPPLPYAYDALAPYISSETLHLHHDKHHQTYVTNLNNLTKDTPLANASLEEVIKASAGDSSKVGKVKKIKNEKKKKERKNGKERTEVGK